MKTKIINCLSFLVLGVFMSAQSQTLVAQYNFDGDVNNFISNPGTDGTIAYFAGGSAPDYVTDSGHTAFRFDSGKRIDFNWNPTLNNQGFIITMWIKILGTSSGWPNFYKGAPIMFFGNTTMGQQGLIGSQSTLSCYPKFGNYDDNGRLAYGSCSNYDSTLSNSIFCEERLNSPYYLSFNKWIFIGIRYNGNGFDESNYDFFIDTNKVPDSRKNSTGNMPFSTINNMSFGCIEMNDYFVTQTLNGLIDDIRIYEGVGTEYQDSILIDSLARSFNPISKTDEIINNLIVYPNPTYGFFHLPKDKKYSSIQIIDISGKVIKEINQNEYLVDISDLLSGFYLIRCQEGKKTYQAKIIKK